MRIDNTNVGGISPDAGSAIQKRSAEEAARVVGRGEGGEEPFAVAGGDQVDLSGLSRALHSPEREEKVRALAAAVQSGSYRVDAESLARKMIDEALKG